MSKVMDRFGQQVGVNKKSYVSRYIGDYQTKFKREKQMDRATLAEMARRHWKTWLPVKTAELEATGEFTEAIQGAAALAQHTINDLMAQGYQEHEAAEIALKDYILLTPEPPDPDDWEAQELAEMEDRYQEMMKEPPEADA